MGDYIKHRYIEGEIKIGVHRGNEIESFYPKWVLEKFLVSGYEDKDTIQDYLDKWDKVLCYDYKKFDTEKLYQVYVNGFGISRISKIVSSWESEGYLIRVKKGNSFINVANSYTIEFLLNQEKMMNVSLEFRDYHPTDVVEEVKEPILIPNGGLPF